VVGEIQNFYVIQKGMQRRFVLLAPGRDFNALEQYRRAKTIPPLTIPFL
jgi:hypothetical protein